MRHRRSQPPPSLPPPIPGIPPLLSNKFSRLIFHDLVPELTRLRDGGTAFIPNAVRIGFSRSFFRDEPFIERITFSNKSCPLILDPFEASFTTRNTSRSEVNFYVDPEKPECALPMEGKALTFFNLNEQCGQSVVPGETVTGLTFEPRCLIVTIAPNSRRDLFDQLIAAGRSLNDPLIVEVNYTIATEQEPNVEAASTNCQNSEVLWTNYQSDTILQSEFTELSQVRKDILSTQGEIDFAILASKNQRFFQPPSSPPLPRPPPAPALNPPAPPQQVTFAEYILQLETRKAVFQARESVLLGLIDGCQAFGPSRTRKCGIPIDEGPNPWISESGKPCRGNATRSARFGDYCGYWDAAYNPLAAPADELAELIADGASCYADEFGTEILECSGKAQRTQRAGVHELKQWLRDDRDYCSSSFFRSRIVPDPPALYSEETCRGILAARNKTCFLECDTCNAFCTSGVARSIAQTYKCTIDLPVLGIATATRVSDAGQYIAYGHGAIRKTGRKPTPENVYLEQYNVLIQNNVEHPLINRESVSCRRPHRESRNGKYTSPLDNQGKPKAKNGFMVPCTTNLDCQSRCGTHPASGYAFSCTPNPKFYSFHVVNESLTEEGLADELSRQVSDPSLPARADYESIEARLALLEARPRWIPTSDTATTKAYFVDEPGHDRFDIPAGSYGVCTDVRYDFQHSGCDSRTASAVINGLVGCTGKVSFINIFFCGSRVELTGPDFNDASIDASSLGYPRTLVEGASTNGIVQQRVECADPVDCSTKCERFARTSRDGGMDIPWNCNLCESVCPSNVVTTLLQVREAFAIDIGNAVRLIFQCFASGLGGGGNIFGLLANKILELTVQSQEDVLNGLIIDPINSLFDNLPWPLNKIGKPFPRACLTGYWKPGGRCWAGDQDFYNSYGCYKTLNARADSQCYFLRQRAICGLEGGSNRFERYQNLFEAPTGSELEAQYQDLVGKDYSTIHPTLAAVVDSVTSSTLSEDAQEARNVCDNSIYSSMDLDEIILACMFHHIGAFCPSSDSSQKFQTFLKSIDWRLPAVTWDWTAPPPPPPGLLKRGTLAKLAILDSEGFARAEQILDDYFPSLEFIVSKSTGSQLRGKYGPKYFVQKYEATTAFMSTESFDDKNSISARMIQARFANYGRFSCISMLEFASERDNAAAGTVHQDPTTKADNPPGYNSPYDRNWLLMFATVFTESLMKETGVTTLEVNVLDWWREQCEEPAAYRSPVPAAMWRADAQRLGTTDAFGTSVEARDFAPLVSYGSLRQLRSDFGAADLQFVEDPSNSLEFYQESEDADLSNTFGSSSTTGSSSRFTYGRRRMDDEASNDLEWTEALHFEGDNETSVSVTTSQLPSPSRKRGGRRLFISGLLSRLITKALGVVEYESLDKQYNFGVPSTSNPHFYFDRIARKTPIAKDLLRDVICNPSYDLTIEQVVGDPPPHKATDTLVDSSAWNAPRDLTTPAQLRGADLDNSYAANGPGGSSPSYKDTSLQGWVYITSSDDPDQPVGFHRLADVRMFPNMKCNEIKDQPCGSVRNSGSTGSSASTSSWQALSWFNLLSSGFFFGRRKLATSERAGTDAITYVVANVGDFTERSVVSFQTGIEALLASRCSTWLASQSIAGASACVGTQTSWYADTFNFGGCASGRLELTDTSKYRSRSAYLGRFRPPPPPPRPPPKSPPPAPPIPPPPSASPSPPTFASRDAAIEFARKIQRDFCDSVYLLGAETRCAALAKELHVQFQLDYTWGNPQRPPIAPQTLQPPPPPKPPSPKPPEAEARIVRLVPIHKATLSTYFVPQIAPSPPPGVVLAAFTQEADYGDTNANAVTAEAASASTSSPTASVSSSYGRRKLQDTGASEYGVAVDSQTRDVLDATLQTLGSNMDVWAACTDSMIAAGAPLPCRTAGNPLRCLDGQRHCTSAYANTFEPFVELDFQNYQPDYGGRMFFFAIRFRIPPQEEYGRLLFHPLEAYGGDQQANRGWRLEVFDANHHKLSTQCQDWNYASSVTEWSLGLTDITHRCLNGLASDADFNELAKTRYVRITLIGEYRQLWVDTIDVFFRAIVDVDAQGNTVVLGAPTPPPPRGEPLPAPPATPDPSPPPTVTGTYTFNVNQAPPSWEQYIVAREPCGIDAEACHVFARQFSGQVNSFLLSSSGCCVLLYSSGGFGHAPLEPYQHGSAGLGVLS